MSGITLVALVVTIVVLLILAGITITMLFGENGIIRKAQDAAEATKNDQNTTEQGLKNLADQMNAALGGNTEGGGSGEVVDINTLKTGFASENKKGKDKHGNIVTVPQGFKVVEGTPGQEITVQNGVVIEDSDGNQFVWIPVGEVKKSDGTTSNEIVLGRYTFSTSAVTEGEVTIPAGTPTLKQAAYTKNADGTYTDNYGSEVPIDTNYKELSTYREGDASSNENATAKNLKGFVDSVKTNGGYYLARYEASYGSGTTVADYKPLSKPSIATSFNASTVGSLWNNITELDASKVCQNMYAGKTVGVESDLVNSYAWDTAIVYIQEMGTDNFANKNRDDVGSTGLANTGSNSTDKFCNIYDMVANTYEWTTEYSTHRHGGGVFPCVPRGGRYGNSSYYTAGRMSISATGSSDVLSFRPLCYVKQH